MKGRLPDGALVELGGKVLGPLGVQSRETEDQRHTDGRRKDDEGDEGDGELLSGDVRLRVGVHQQGTLHACRGVQGAVLGATGAVVCATTTTTSTKGRTLSTANFGEHC